MFDAFSRCMSCKVCIFLRCVLLGAAKDQGIALARLTDADFEKLPDAVRLSY